MTAIESSTTMPIDLFTNVITDSPDSIDTSILSIQSPIVILIWFEIIAACLVYGLGFLGNLLSLIIFCSSDEFRRISTGFFFLLTTISNSFHLWTLTTEFLGVFSIYVYSNGFLECRLNFFVQNVSRAMSTYLAIGIAFDRLLRSELPIRSRRIFWSLWFSPTITQDSLTGKCINNGSPIFYFYLSQVQIPVRLVIVCIIPVIVMIAANIRMLYNMRQSHRRVANRVEVQTITTINNATIRRMTAIDRMLFYMMLANIGTFIITQVPFHIYATVRSYYQELDPLTNSLVRTLLLIWSSIYFGVAFYLYCFASPLFREKFKLMSTQFIHFLKRRPVREI